MTAWKAETLLSDLFVNMTEGFSASMQRINKGFSDSGSFWGFASTVLQELVHAIKLAASIFAMMCIKHILDGSQLQLFMTTTLTSAITATTQYLIALPIIAQIVVLSLVIVMSLPYLLEAAKPISSLLTRTAKALITHRDQAEHVESQQFTRAELPSDLKKEVLHAVEDALEYAYADVAGRSSIRATTHTQTTVDIASNKQLHRLVCEAAQAILDKTFSGNESDRERIADAFAKHMGVQLRIAPSEQKSLTLEDLRAHQLLKTNQRRHLTKSKSRSETPFTATTRESTSPVNGSGSVN
jgi:hypothetical protein